MQEQRKTSETASAQRRKTARTAHGREETRRTQHHKYEHTYNKLESKQEVPARRLLPHATRRPSAHTHPTVPNEGTPRRQRRQLRQ